MKEKKLTDKEIIKAWDICNSTPCCTSECPYFNKNGRNFCMEDKALYKDLKRIVQKYAEQKAEIERLTEENKAIRINCENARNITGQMFDKNDELQKQVDELKANQIIECHGMLKVCDMVKQAVKDTAKEILQEVLSLCKNAEEKLSIMFGNKRSGYGEGYKNSVAHFNECILKLAKENGVEVE